MAKLRVLYLVVSFLSVCHGLEDFKGLFSNPQRCEDACMKSYSPHTNPNEGGESDACSRGCRLYTITEFTTHNDLLFSKEGDTPLQTAKESCYSACVEAYNETSSNTVACKSGCESQEELSRQEKEQPKENEEPSMHLLSPLMQVRSFYSSVVGAVHVVRTSLVTYFASDDNKIVAVESAPKVMVELLGKESVEDSKPLPSSPTLKILPQEQEEEADDGLGSGVPSMVKCVSKRLGVPPPLLIVTSLVLVLFAIYVIFAVCTTASPPKARKEGLSVQSEAMPVPIKLVRPEDLTKLSLMDDDDLQAPPLPVKVKLPDTQV